MKILFLYLVLPYHHSISQPWYQLPSVEPTRQFFFPLLLSYPLPPLPPARYTVLAPSASLARRGASSPLPRWARRRSCSLRPPSPAAAPPPSPLPRRAWCGGGGPHGAAAEQEAPRDGLRAAPHLPSAAPPSLPGLSLFPALPPFGSPPAPSL